MSLSRVKLLEVFPESQERWVLADLDQFRGPAGPSGPAGRPGSDDGSGEDALVREVPPSRVLGRLNSPTGKVEYLDGDDLRRFLRTAIGALADFDGEALLDLDGRPLYEPGAIIDNPPVGLRTFSTVAEMVAVADPWEVNQALCLNGDDGDGNPTDWLMVASPGLVADGHSVLEHADGYGFFVRRGTTLVSFQTVEAMLAAPSTFWSRAMCLNNVGLDRVMTIWERVLPFVLANGMDVLQTDDGAKLLRVWYREAPDPWTTVYP